MERRRTESATSGWAVRPTWELIVLALLFLAASTRWLLVDGATSRVPESLGIGIVAYMMGLRIQAKRDARTAKQRLCPTPPSSTYWRRVRLGEVQISAAAQKVASEADARALVALHEEGDWGEVSEVERARNHAAAQGRGRIVSHYRLGNGAVLFVATEGRATTVCLPEECWEGSPHAAPEPTEEPPEYTNERRWRRGRGRRRSDGQQRRRGRQSDRS